MHWSLRMVWRATLLPDPDIAMIAVLALYLVITFGTALALNSIPSAFRRKKPGQYLRQQIAIACPVVLCLALYVWSLKPHFLVYPDRLEISSFTSDKTLDFSSIQQVTIISRQRKGMRFYSLKFTSHNNENTYVSMPPSSLTTVLAHLPVDIDCQTGKPLNTEES